MMTMKAIFALLAILPITSPDFNRANDLGPAVVVADNGADPVGAFRFICGAGQVNHDDPIVYPGQRGKSHLHQFYGNTATNYATTYKSGRTTGLSTCGSIANRSSYWMPALLDGFGHVIQPDYVTIYYKRIPASDPHCNDPSRTDLKAEGICVPIPTGLKMIYGYDMVTNTPPTGHHHFACVQGSTPIATSPLLVDVIGNCPAGDKIEAMISAPDCWDGVHVDSLNHRTHVAYSSYGNWGYPRCDAAHPYLMPTFTLGAFYTVQTGDNLKLWHFSSDAMHTELPYGSTFHADYLEDWEPTVKAEWTGNCIDRHLNCFSGNLGDGFRIKGADKPSYGWVNPNPRVSL